MRPELATILDYGKVKRKFVPVDTMKASNGADVWLHLLLTSALAGLDYTRNKMCSAHTSSLQVFSRKDKDTVTSI
jgi:hypothetical protein